MNTKIMVVTLMAFVLSCPINAGEWTYMDEEVQSGVVSGWSGYPGNISNFVSLDNQATDGLPDVAWEAYISPTQGSHLAIARWDESLFRWVGRVDGRTIDFIRMPGFNKKPALAHLPGMLPGSDVPLIVAVRTPLVNPGNIPPKAILISHDAASGTYKVSTVLKHGCTSNCGGAAMEVDIAANPQGGWGIVVSDGKRLRYVSNDGNGTLNVVETIRIASAIVTSVKLEFQPSGNPVVTYTGGLVGGGYTNTHMAVRTSPGNWNVATFGPAKMLGLAIAQSGEISVGLINAAGQVVIRTNSTGWVPVVINSPTDIAGGDLSLKYDSIGRLGVIWYSETETDLLFLRRVGTSWENMTGGTTPEVATTDPQSNGLPSLGFDLADLPHVVYQKGGVSHRHYVP
jgi:hypothetical protein